MIDLSFQLSLARLLTLITIFAVGTAAIFLVIMTVVRWQRILQMRPLYAVLYWVIIIFALYSTVIRMFIYEAGKEPAPFWYPRVIDGFWLIICGLMITVLWERHKPGTH